AQARRVALRSVPRPHRAPGCDFPHTFRKDTRVPNRNVRTPLARRNAKAPPSPRRRPGLEPLEARCLLSRVTGYRPLSQRGNNAATPNWGVANTDLLRLAPVGYSDGVSAPSLAQDPSARIVSNLLNSQADPNNPGFDLNTVDRNSLSDFGYAFGQFMDH